MPVNKMSTWIVNFILHYGEMVVCKVISVNADNAANAAERAGDFIQRTYLGMKFFIHNIGIAADQKAEDGNICNDPIGWDKDELEDFTIDFFNEC